MYDLLWSKALVKGLLCLADFPLKGECTTQITDDLAGCVKSWLYHLVVGGVT